MPITRPGDSVDFGAFDSSAPTAPNVGDNEAIITPTTGPVFGGPAQPVPGGLLGLLSASAVPLQLQGLLAAAVHNSANDVTASIELAGPATPSTDVDRTATSAFFNGINALIGGVTLRLPVRIHLQSQFLGASCDIWSNSNPILLDLQTDTTNPPPPNQPITGTTGSLTFFDNFGGLTLIGTTFVDNSFGAPAATGCGPGGALNNAINLKESLPSPPGRNAAMLVTSTELAVKCFATQGPC